MPSIQETRCSEQITLASVWYMERRTRRFFFDLQDAADWVAFQETHGICDRYTLTELHLGHVFGRVNQSLDREDNPPVAVKRARRKA